MRAAAVTIVLAAAVLGVAGCGNGPGSAPPVEPADLSQAPRAVVWAVGDAATPGPDADRVARMIRRARPDRFLYLGDVYETGTAAEFRRWYDARYGKLARIT